MENKENNFFKEGDKYIHFTKYGGVNRGVVKSVYATHCTDLENLVSYYSISIITDKGIGLSLDGSDGRIYKVGREFTKEQAEKIAAGFKALSERKAQTRKLVQNMVMKAEKTSTP